MIETREKEIGGYVYAVTQLGALQGRGVYTRLLKILGPVLPRLNKGDAAAAIGALAESLAEADVEFFTEAFRGKTVARATDGSKTVVMSRPEAFDVHFAGDYGTLTDWLIFCFEVNFSSFFDKATSLASVAGVRPEAK